MTVSSAEINVQRKITAAFINTQPVQLVLQPRLKVKKNTGGSGWEETEPRDPQTLRLVEPPASGARIRTADGVERVVEFMLLGSHTAEIGLYDVFEHAGGDWEVIFLYHENGWERRAEVARRG